MPRIHVGIDVAKFKHTCCIVSSEGEILRESFDFGNDREGFDRLDSPDKLTKYAGLDVNIYQSGTVSRHGKTGKKGPPILRYALFLAGCKCRIHCPEIAEYYSSKVAQGKHRICALTCTARKILRICWGMMKTGKSYSPKASD